MSAASFFVLRTPLLPLEWFRNWAAADDASLSGAPTHGATREDLIAHLQRLLSRPDVREAIFIASPSLHDRYYKSRNAATVLSDEKLLTSLVRYVTRMLTRCTPFGLCAGVATGNIGTTTTLRLCDNSARKRMTRLSLRYVERLIEALSSAGTYDDCRYTANDTWYEISGVIRYMYWTTRDSGRHYQLATAQKCDELLFVLKRARHAIALGELVAAVASQVPGASEQSARSFVESAIRARLLVPEWTARITGSDPFELLLTELADCTVTRKLGTHLGNVQRALARLDDIGITGSTESYDAIRQKLQVLPVEPERSRLFKVDLINTLAPGQLSQAVVHAVGRCALACQRLLSEHPAERELDQIKARFQRRFGDAEVPLMLALDDAFGGLMTRTNLHANPVLQQLDLTPSQASPTLGWGAVEDMLTRKLHASLAAGTVEIVIDHDQLESLPPAQNAGLPPSFCAMLSLLPRGSHGIEAGDILLHSLFGPVGASMLARFCPADAAYATQVQSYIREEQSERSDQIVAEVVHVPPLGLPVENVLLRPVLREYEIPYAGRSGAPLDRQILVSDLWLSLRDGQFVLRSQSLDKEIVPRLTTAHVYTAADNLPLYCFLGLLQHQQRYWSGFRWGRAFEHAPFLPRVRVGSVIVSLARWRIPGGTLDTGRTLSADARTSWLQRLRADRQLPRYVSIGTTDHILAIDLENPLCVDNLFAQTRHGLDVVLTEAPQLAGSSCVTSPEGSFCHEILLPFNYKVSHATARTATSPPARRIATQQFPPGTQWLYLKVHCAPAAADQILTGSIARIAANALDQQIIDHWFFVRYAEPDFHLRLRFYGDPRRLLTELLPTVIDALNPRSQVGQLANIELDTYQPETIRYGGALTTQLCEALFFQDSSTVLELLPCINSSRSRDLRWQTACVVMHQLLSSFNFGLEWNREMTRGLTEAIRTEFRISQATKQQLSERYRAHKDLLYTVLSGGNSKDTGLHQCVQIVSARRFAYQSGIARLRTSLPADPADPVLRSIGASLLHMHANRIFAAQARENEMIVYDFLDRTYRSMLARGLH